MSIGIPTAIALQPDGRVLSAWIGRIARFNGDGGADGTFASVDITQTLNGGIRDFEIQPNGKILVGGGFSKINGTNRNGIARLNADGTLDSAFAPGVGSDGDVNGTTRRHIARLNTDGSHDTTFNPGSGTDADVTAIAVQPDGNIIIAGDFLTVDGVLRSYIARLFGDSAGPSLSILRSNNFAILSRPASFGNFQLQENTNISLANSWSAVSAARSTNNSLISLTLPTTGSRKFFRLSSP